MEKTEVQHQTHLDATIKLLAGDLGEAASRAGLDNHFQNWIDELKAANNAEFHTLIVDLQELKAHFHGGTLDADIINPLLARLGRNTTIAARFATGNTEPRVAKLGEVLTGVAQHLRHGADKPDGHLPQDKSSH